MKSQNALNRLNEKLETLRNKLGQEYKSEKNFDILLKQIREAEAQVNDLELINRVEVINKREAKKREILKKIVAIGPVNGELLTNDGRLNKTKSKQAPELYKLADQYSLYFKVSYSGIIRVNVYTGRQSFEFDTGYKDYNLPREEQKIEPFKDFSHACQINGVQEKKITVAKVKKQLQALKKANDKFKAETEKFEAAQKKNNAYFLECEGIISNQTTTTRINYSKYM